MASAEVSESSRASVRSSIRAGRWLYISSVAESSTPSSMRSVMDSSSPSSTALRSPRAIASAASTIRCGASSEVGSSAVSMMTILSLMRRLRKMEAVRRPWLSSGRNEVMSSAKLSRAANHPMTSVLSASSVQSSARRRCSRS